MSRNTILFRKESKLVRYISSNTILRLYSALPAYKNDKGICGPGLQKTTTSRRRNFNVRDSEFSDAVRETGVSRHHGGPLKPLRLSQYSIVLRGLRGALNWAPIMPRDAFFQSSRGLDT